MYRVKNIFGFLLILAILGGLGWFAYYSVENRENIVTFQTDAGEINLDNIKVNMGEDVSLPKLTREGYVFLGWFYDKEYANPCGESIVIDKKGTTRLYASWQKKRYPVTKTSLFSGINTEYVEFEEKCNLKLAEPDVGYRVVWTYEDTGEEIKDSSIVVTGEVRLLEVMKPKTYTIRYFNELGKKLLYTREVVFDKTDDEDKIYIDNEALNVVGHSLDNWYYKDKYNNEVAINRMAFLSASMVQLADSNDVIDVFGQYVVNQYELKFYDEDNEVLSFDVDYGEYISSYLSQAVSSNVFNTLHKSLSGWKFKGDENSTSFADYRMPAYTVEIEPVYILSEYTVSFYANIKDNKIKVKELTCTYKDSITSANMPSDAEIIDKIEELKDAGDWIGYYDFDEFNFENYTLNDETASLTESQLVARLTTIEDDQDITLNFYKNKFYIEYFRDMNLQDLYDRVQITTEDNFQIISTMPTDSDDIVFGGWVFANNPEKLFEFDSFGLIERNSDVQVYADFYYDEVNQWETKVIDGKIYITEYKGSGRDNILIPTQLNGGNVYCVGDGENQIQKRLYARGVKRFLIPETIKVINTNAFKNSKSYIRFVNKPNQDADRYPLTIKEKAFISDTNQSNSYSITSIKLPIRTSVIEEGAFAGAIDLRSITLSQGLSGYYCDDGVLYKEPTSEMGKVLICYPCAKEGDTFELPNDIERIGNFAFQINVAASSVSSTEKTSELKYVRTTNRNSLKEIGKGAFYGNYQLKSIIMPYLPNLSSIAEYVFFSCFNNNSNVISSDRFEFDFNHLSVVPENFLTYARILNYLTLNNTENIEIVSDSAFQYVGNLTTNSTRELSFVLSGDYKRIGNYAFQNSKMQIYFDSSFEMVSSNGEKPVIGQGALSSNMNVDSIVSNYLIIKSVDTDYTLSLTNVKIGGLAFQHANIGLSLEFIDCELPSGSTGFLDYSKVAGSVSIIFIDDNQKIPEYLLAKVDVSNDILIDYRGAKGTIERLALYNVKCTTMTINGISSFNGNEFGLFGGGDGAVPYDDTVSANLLYGPLNIIFGEDCTFTSLTSKAFYTCPRVKTITLCSSIMTLNYNAFTTDGRYGNSPTTTIPLPNLEKIIINGSDNVVNIYSPNDENIVVSGEAKFYVSEDIIEEYKLELKWLAFFNDNKLLIIE